MPAAPTTRLGRCLGSDETAGAAGAGAAGAAAETSGLESAGSAGASAARFWQANG